MSAGYIPTLSTLLSLLFPLTQKLVEFWVRASNPPINIVPTRLLPGLNPQASQCCISKATEHLLGEGIYPEHLNDDRLGRVVEKLYNPALESTILTDLYSQ